MITLTVLSILTFVTQLGRPQSVLMSLWEWRTPFLSTFLSKTSMPNTLGLSGLGYLRHAAWVTVSHGWLKHTSAQPAIKTHWYDITHKALATCYIHVMLLTGYQTITALAFSMWCHTTHQLSDRFSNEKIQVLSQVKILDLQYSIFFY